MTRTKSNILILAVCGVLISLYGCTDSSNPTTTPTTITVAGKVVDAYGYPLSSASTVLIGTQTATTAGDGSFSISSVSTTYDAYVMNTNGVFGVKGLTITNPYLPGSITGGSSGSIGVNVPIVPVGSRVTVIFQDTVTGKVSGFGQITAGQISGSASITGTNGQPVAGKLYVIQYTISPIGVVGTFTGYAEQSVAFTFGNNPSYAFTSYAGGLGTQTVSGTVNGAGGTNLEAQLYVNFGNKNNIVHRGGFLQTIPISGSSGAFTFNVPTNTISTAQINVVALSTLPTVSLRMKTLSAGVSGAVISIDTAASLLTPSTGTANVDSTSLFSYTNGGGNGVHFVRLTPLANGRLFQIITKGTSFNLPNLSAYGYNLSSSIQYTWNEIKTSDVNSTNDFCAQFYDINSAILGTSISNSFTFTAR